MSKSHTNFLSYHKHTIPHLYNHLSIQLLRIKRNEDFNFKKDGKEIF